MRELFTLESAVGRGVTKAAVLWAEQTASCTRIVRGVYGRGPERPTALDRARAKVLRANAVASGDLAGVLHGLDGVELAAARVWRRALPPDRVVERHGLRVTSVLQTLIDLAGSLSDDKWEQALECALRKRMVTITQVKAELSALGRSRTPGTARIRRVLAGRPDGAPPTGSLLETLMVQLVRTIVGLEPPVRQVNIYDKHGTFIARVDLAWPSLGIFIELDGQQHKDQPIYDARRETAVVAATGWLCGRFTWAEVTRVPTTTARRLAAIVEQAKARPIAS